MVMGSQTDTQAQTNQGRTGRGPERGVRAEPSLGHHPPTTWMCSPPWELVASRFGSFYPSAISFGVAKTPRDG